MIQIETVVDLICRGASFHQSIYCGAQMSIEFSLRASDNMCLHSPSVQISDAIHQFTAKRICVFVLLLTFAIERNGNSIWFVNTSEERKKPIVSIAMLIICAVDNGCMRIDLVEVVIGVNLTLPIRSIRCESCRHFTTLPRCQLLSPPFLFQRDTFPISPAMITAAASTFQSSTHLTGINDKN